MTPVPQPGMLGLMDHSVSRVADLERRYGRVGPRVLDGLLAAHRTLGRIDAATVAEVADGAGVPRAHVHGAATYYADLRPGDGRHVCAGAACFAARGGPPGAAMGDGQAVQCLGACFGAPSALDHGRLVRDAPGDGDMPPIPWAVDAPEAVVLAGLAGTLPAWSALDAAAGDGAAVLRAVADAGLTGRGGAGFPVARKWRAAAESPAPHGERYVVANGDEGDPGSYVDRLLMERDPERILEGMALAALACDATHGVVYVRSEYPAARDALHAAIARARAAGRLGAGFDVEVVQGAGSYVSGEETALIRSIEGLRGGAAARPPYPARSGVYGRPTVVNNVETLAAVPWIVCRGATAYRALGTPDEPGTEVVCLNERFVRPAAYEVELGTPVRRIVEELGGGLRDGRSLRALQVGGPLGGFLGPADLDVPLTARALRGLGVELGHGSLVAFDDRVCGAAILEHLWTFAASESCGHCAPCRVGTRRGVELTARLAAGADPDEVLAVHGRLLDVLQATSLCGLGVGVAGAIRSLLRVVALEEDAT